ALAQVPGATVDNIREFGVDYDDGRLEYEGKIYYDHMEYEFEIDGYSGAIRSWDVESVYD
ncbi:MAG: PepSY domain-containing protein, partial [Oscillospiraceae bacterium]|nr:PepSY domain-containing protein [Oscillospiraceae bacterium]